MLKLGKEGTYMPLFESLKRKRQKRNSVILLKEQKRDGTRGEKKKLESDVLEREYLTSL